MALQPPPRGCVLKLYRYQSAPYLLSAAASARLCVETFLGFALPVPCSCSRLRAAVC